MPIRSIEEYLRPLDIAFEEYTFIDYGCGKGRALLLASEYPFERIIGVEYAPELVVIAQRNIELYRSGTQRCRSITVVESDAAAFAPPAVPTVYFLYNPFDGVVLTKVLDRIRRCNLQNRRLNYLIYVEPRERSCIDADCEWRKVVDHGGWLLFQHVRSPDTLTPSRPR